MRAGAAALPLFLGAVFLPSMPASARQLAPPPMHPFGFVHEHRGPDGEIDVNVCPSPKPGHVTCLARLRVDAAARAARPLGLGGEIPPQDIGDGGAYSPAYLQSAYNAPSATRGSGQTVAIVDAYDDPNAESDLAVYRSHYGLSPCTTANGCFRKVDQSGGTSYPSPDGNWAVEISLDLDMVSALCPSCHILLIEALNPALPNLAQAESEAVTLGANVISNSYGGSEGFNEASYDAHFDHPGVAITVASGDAGYYTEYPAVSPDVTAVGGTSLLQATATGTRDATETEWNGSGSGCSWLEPKPSWQHDDGCAMRSVADVSAVADPATPVWLYDTYPNNGTTLNWAGAGGTSASAPIVAGIYALAQGPSGPAYHLAGYPYARTAQLNDITSGSVAYYCPGGLSISYLCAAGPGYDGPTGLGTPNGIRAFQPSPPSAPLQLRAGAFGGAAVLSWSAPATTGGADVTAYRIYRADHGSTPIASVGPTSSYVDSGLTNGTSYTYTVKAVNAVGKGKAASVSATPEPLDHLILSPSGGTVTAGTQQPYTATGFDSSNTSLGDETAAASFSIAPNGSCTGSTCTASATGDHTVTATLAAKTAGTTLHVRPGPLDHLKLSPANATISAGGSQTYSTKGFDSFGNKLGSETANTAFSIAPDGSCTGATCTPVTSGDHTVTGAIKHNAVSAGLAGTCAVTAVTGLKCWGDNGFGQLGNPGVTGNCNGDGSSICSAVPVDVAGFTSGVASVSAGLWHSCAVTMDGGAKCWGWNNNGWNGNGTLSNSSLPADVYDLTSGVAAISTGFDHTCALTTAGGVKCWGANGEYQGPGGLGDGTANDSLIPVDVSGLTSGVDSVSVGTGFTCAITTGGGVKCWGANLFGELGDGDTSHCASSPWPCSLVPVDVWGLASGVAAIAVGDNHACALTTAGGVKCWGLDLYGQLGDAGTTSDCNPGWPNTPCSLVPVDVSGLGSGVAAISAGEGHTCAVRTGGGVKCWGWNFRGMLGDGTTTDSNVPVKVLHLTHVSQLSVGNFHACALTTEDVVRCWGLDGLGALGDGTTTDNTASSGPTNAIALKAKVVLHVQ
jgi:alpha-tubulin suppressor-like RCC1 family protein